MNASEVRELSKVIREAIEDSPDLKPMDPLEDLIIPVYRRKIAKELREVRSELKRTGRIGPGAVVQYEHNKGKMNGLLISVDLLWEIKFIRPRLKKRK